jgi:hypothetical protein
MIMKGSVDVRFPLSRGADAANKGWEPRQHTLGDRSELPGQRVDQPPTTAGCHMILVGWRMAGTAVVLFFSHGLSHLEVALAGAGLASRRCW